MVLLCYELQIDTLLRHYFLVNCIITWCKVIIGNNIKNKKVQGWINNQNLRVWSLNLVQRHLKIIAWHQVFTAVSVLNLLPLRSHVTSLHASVFAITFYFMPWIIFTFYRDRNRSVYESQVFNMLCWWGLRLEGHSGNMLYVFNICLSKIQWTEVLGQLGVATGPLRPSWTCLNVFGFILLVMVP